MGSCDENGNNIAASNCGIVSDINCNIDTNGSNMLLPILTRRIIGCVEYTLSNVDIVNNMNFQLKDLGITYPAGGTVCIDNISYSYDYIGLTNNPISARISCSNISLLPADSYTITNGSQRVSLYNEYLGTANLSCCDCIEKVKFIEQSLEFYINNLVITAQGTIGGQPFIGTYTYTYTGTLI